MHNPSSLQASQTLDKKSMKELFFHIQVFVGLMQVLVTLSVSIILRLCLLSSDSIWLGKNYPSGFYGYADDQIESTTQLNWWTTLYSWIHHFQRKITTSEAAHDFQSQSMTTQVWQTGFLEAWVCNLGELYSYHVHRC